MSVPATERVVRSSSPAQISVLNGDAAGVGGKLAAQVARRIEEDIIRAGWPVGTVLGSEQALIERYGVSRAVFREAVRIVEHHQVAATRRGPAGGLVVRAPDEAAVATALGVYLEHIGVTIESILRARAIVESLAATLAPTRITEADIGVLRGIITGEQAGNDPTDLEAHHALHHAIAVASGNPVLVLFVDVLNALALRYCAREFLAPSHGDGQPHGDIAPPAEVTEQIHLDHAAIAEAVIGGDAARAEHLAIEHIEAMHRRMIRPSADGEERPIRSSATGFAAGLDGGGPPSKLAETVAGRIRDDVSRAGQPVGTVIGSEGELLVRYGVSRSVLREAVRLLEYHSVARMRRGPGGGLLVGEPDPSATIETTALYLEYSRAGLEHLRVVRHALELGCIDILLERRDAALIDQLTALHAAEDAAIEKGVIERAAGAADTGDAAGRTVGDETSQGAGGRRSSGHQLHLELARLTGNEALATFVRVLTDVWPRHLASSPTGPTEAADDLDDRAAHQGILQAIIDGDRGLALHRMRRHLEALTAMAAIPS